MMAGRISRIGHGNFLKVIEKKIDNESFVIEKLLTLKMEGKEINILDPHAKVTFQSGYTLSIREIFHIFIKKSLPQVIGVYE